MFRRIIAALLAPLMLIGLVGVLSTLAGCNTVEGIGKDVSRAGNEIREEANEQRRR